MTGGMVLRLAGHLLRADTIALIVSPAVGDLQYERAMHAPSTYLRGYVAVWVALIGALCHEAIWDPRGPAWMDHLHSILTITFIVTSYYVALSILLLGFSVWRRPPTASVVPAVLGNGWLLTTVSVTALVAAVALRARMRALADQSLAPKPDA